MSVKKLQTLGKINICPSPNMDLFPTLFQTFIRRLERFYLFQSRLKLGPGILTQELSLE